MFSTFSGIAQESAGLILGKYSGLNSLSLNPSFAFKNEHKWDFRLAGGHFFANTDYATISNANLFKVVQDDADIFVPLSVNDVVPDNADMVVKFNEQSGSSINLNGEILGPGFVFSLGEKVKLGASLNLRMIGGSKGISEALNYNNFLAPVEDSIYTMNPLELGAMVWSEFSIHYAQKINERLSFGTSVKYLKGNASVFGKNEFSLDVLEFNEGEAQILSDGRFIMGYDDHWPDEVFSGNGLGMDLGVSFNQVMGSKLQLGVSILDLGFVFYNRDLYRYTINRDQILRLEDYEDIDNLEDLNQQLGQDFDVELVSGYRMQLPTALAIQGSLNVHRNVSLEGYWVQGLDLPFGETTSYRANSVNLTGVYDRKHFSAFLPVTLYDYRDLRIGTALRFGFLTIGSDKVSSLLWSKDFNGTDVYVNVLVYPFRLWERKNKGKSKGGDVKCYEW